MSNRLSDRIVAILKHLGVKTIFGIPGDTIDTLMDSLRIEKDIEFVVTRHEENAAFMANGYARVSSKIGVVVACQGPGANNLVNGIADAFSDNIPLIALTGQISTDKIGTSMPQGSSQLKLFDDITLFNEEARSVKNFLELFNIAINIAITQKGPVHISIPSDIMLQDAIAFNMPNVPLPSRLLPNESVMEEALSLIEKNKKIAILYGEGSRGCQEELITLSKCLNAPLIHTTRSKDIIDNTFENVMGGLGIMGSYAANSALHKCEILLIFGSNFAFEEFYPSKATLIKIDNSAKNLSTHIQVDLAIHSDVKEALTIMLQALDQHEDDSYLKHSQKDLHKYIDKYINFNPHAHKLQPTHIINEVQKHLQPNTNIFGDSGTTTIWFNNVAKLNGKQRFIWSANLATLGGSFPQALGSCFHQDKAVVFAGDGGFEMSISDLSTASTYQKNLKIFIFNNGAYKFIEFEQAAHDGDVPSGTQFLNPNFSQLAESMHGTGYSIKEVSQVKDIVEKAFKTKGLVVVDCHIDKDSFLIPPAVTPKMAYNYLKSQVKGWFTPSSHESELLETYAKEHEQSKA